MRINKRNWIIAAVGLVFIFIITVSAGNIHKMYVKARLEPDQVLFQSLKNMEELHSYKYNMESAFTVDDRKEVISKVLGVKEGENKHIKGEMVHTEIDIYFYDRTIYNYDSLTEKWLVIESGFSNSEDLLISELNPMSNFRFKKVDDIEKLGFEDIDGIECLLVKCKPAVESQILENLWKDFEYKLWLDYDKNLIKKATMSAKNKKNDINLLLLEVQFSDYNEKMNLQAPETTTKR